MINTVNKYIGAACVIAGSTLTMGTASAVVLAGGMQIGLAPGPTATNDAGNDWFDFNTTNTTFNTIHNLDGDTVDGVTVQVVGGGINTAGENNWVGLNSQGGSAPMAFVDSVTTDLWFSGSTLTINGLDTSLTYDLYSVNHGGGPGFDTRLDTHTVTGDVIYGPSTISRGDARLNGSFHSFLGVSPDSSGTIVLTMTDAGPNNPAFNGLLINAIAAPVAVPEPSSTALLGLGGLALLLRRRR